MQNKLSTIDAELKKDRSKTLKRELQFLLTRFDMAP